MTSGTRRTLLTLGGLVAVAAVLRLRPWAGWFPEDVAFAPIEDMPGFRRLVREDVQLSLGLNGPAAGLLIGLEPADRPDPARVQAVRADPCPDLFGDPGARLPIAYFTDIRCPICRVLEGHLADLQAEMGDAITIVTHEYPVFGEPSEIAARALIAAGGAASRLRPRLIRTPAVIDERVLQSLLADLDLDADAVLAAMASDTVAARLETSAILAQSFGFYGTPALVIGRTAIVGAASPTLLRQIVELEQGESPVCPGT